MILRRNAQKSKPALAVAADAWPLLRLRLASSQAGTSRCVDRAACGAVAVMAAVAVGGAVATVVAAAASVAVATAPDKAAAAVMAAAAALLDVTLAVAAEGCPGC